MSENYTTSQVYEDMLETYEWFRFHKIKDFDDPVKSRLPDILKYLKLYNEEFPKFEKKEPNILLDIADDAGSAISEATALNIIRRGLTLYNENHLPKEKLEMCIKGSFHSYDEDPDSNTHQARNALFELETAAYFLLRRYDVIGFNDIEIQVQDNKLFIECKRTSSWGQIKPHFNKAVEQLIRNGVLNNSNSFGIIAFSLEKLFDLDSVPKDKKIDENNKKNVIRMVNNKAHLKRIIVDTVRNMHKVVKPLLKEALKKHKKLKLLGMMYLYRTAVIYKDTKVFSYKREFQHVFRNTWCRPKMRIIKKYIANNIKEI